MVDRTIKTDGHNKKIDRREFLKRSALTTATMAAALGTRTSFAVRKSHNRNSKKVIVIGIDGMDPLLTEELMKSYKLPNFNKLREMGGYRRLGTSIPPQSPVAWANFITGAGPGTHGIFDFFHRQPANKYNLVNSVSHITPASGLPIGKFFLPIFKRPKAILTRQGVPFWDHLDEASIPSAVYMIPSNYPPSPSKYRHHYSLSGLATPDLLGTMGTYQYYTENGPAECKQKNYGRHCRIVFKNDTAECEFLGPKNVFLKKRDPTSIKFHVHRDRQAKAVLIEVQKHKLLLKEHQWSHWIEIDFTLNLPMPLPNEHASGICRFYLQEFDPEFRLYVSPININPAHPNTKISEPENFASNLSKNIGLFGTVGFQEAFMARCNKVFSDYEYLTQAQMILEKRLKLLDYALEHYNDGLLFFYFSSTDLQSHIFWWNSDKKHPFRSLSQAMYYHNHIKVLYKKFDDILGNILKLYGNNATIIALSDHGFSYYKRNFNLNTWLRNNGYIPYCTTLYPKNETLDVPVDWSKTRAYGLGYNGLYLNLQGREHQGIVKSSEREALLQELIIKLEALRDSDGTAVIRKVYRADKVYSGPNLKHAPDLILGPYRGYRITNQSCIGNLQENVLTDNIEAWSADHVFDPREVPGVLFANRPIAAAAPALIDLAPSILTEFGLKIPSSMTGKNIFTT